MLRVPQQNFRRQARRTSLFARAGQHRHRDIQRAANHGASAQVPQCDCLTGRGSTGQHCYQGHPVTDFILQESLSIF